VGPFRGSSSKYIKSKRQRYLTNNITKQKLFSKAKLMGANFWNPLTLTPSYRQTNYRIWTRVRCILDFISAFFLSATEGIVLLMEGSEFFSKIMYIYKTFPQMNEKI